MKILLVNEFYYPIEKGGAEVSARILAEEYVRLGHDVVVITSSDKNFQSVVNNVNVKHVKANPVYWNNFSKPVPVAKKILWHIFDMNNFFVISAIEDVIEKEKPDIIHTNTLSHFSTCVWKIAKKHNIPICHTLRDYYLLCHKCTLFKHGSVCRKQCASCKFSSYFKKKYSKYVDAVVGISKHVLGRHLDEGYFSKSIRQEVIFNSLPTVNVVKNNDLTKKVLGYIGSLIPSKGVAKLIKAFVACNCSEYTLLIAGTGTKEYTDYLKGLCAKSPNIKFLGRVMSDEFYAKIGLLVVPSIWEEPFGRIVIESIAAGVPVLASDKGGIPEIVQGRKEGKIFKTDEENSLKNMLQDYMEGKIEFDFSDVDSFLRQFDSRYVAEQYIRLFKDIVRDS